MVQHVTVAFIRRTAISLKSQNGLVEKRAFRPLPSAKQALE